MPKLLWVGDAAVTTGFSTVTHGVLDNISDKWDKSVMGVNYFGDPHPHDYPIYSVDKDDKYGFDRLPFVWNLVEPDIIVYLSDPWLCPRYMKISPEDVPQVGWLALDGDNFQERWVSGLDKVVLWTYYAANCARAGGYKKPTPIVPLGVDTSFYRPYDKQQCREYFDLPQDKILIGAIATNQPRKRLDLTISYFADLLKRRKDVCLLVHTKPMSIQGWDVKQLAKYFGIPDENCYVHNTPMGIDLREMPLLYSTLDFQISTAQGEGWGLTQMEGMACGVPQIVPDWSALGEWPRSAVKLVPCDEIWVTRGGVNIIGGIPNRKEYLDLMHEMCSNKLMRDELSAKGIELVRQEQYSWGYIAGELEGILDSVLGD